MDITANSIENQVENTQDIKIITITVHWVKRSIIINTTITTEVSIILTRAISITAMKGVVVAIDYSFVH